MSSSNATDVIVVGDGLIGLACANALARSSLHVRVLGRRRPGFASIAAAGLLAPTIEAHAGGAVTFALAARERHRTYVAELHEATGIDVPLDLGGIVRVAASESEGEVLRGEAEGDVQYADPSQVQSLEPAVVAPFGALLHAGDGIVDNVRLLTAVESAAERAGVHRTAADVVRITAHDHSVEVETRLGDRFSARHLVLAGGAWSPLVEGLPRPLPVVPLRGQMMALAGAPVRRPVYGFGGYLAPRGGEGVTIVGSTSEPVGFAAGTTDAALAGFRDVARSLVPALGRADEVRSWSGLRPMTMDGLPILGADPDAPALIFACGHSRNGILMAPLTADVVTALVLGAPLSFDLAAFDVLRFSRQNAAAP